MTVPALFLLAATGLQLGWTVEPATASGPGSIRVSALLEEGDLVFVFGEGPETATFETVATLEGDGEGFARSGGTVVRSELPFMQELVLEDVESGGYRLSLMVRDLESGRVTVREATLDVPVRTAGSWSSSMIRLTGGRERIAGSVDIAWQAFPPAGSEPDVPVTAAYALRSLSGETLQEGWLRDSGGVFIATIPLQSVHSGDYELIVAALLDSTVQTSSALLLGVEEDWDIWGRNASMTADLVRPIADPSLLDEIEDVDSEAGRMAVMSEFWKALDPTPMTERNEYRDLYLERLDTIMERFSRSATPGIETDMGLVYALLGEPDILEDMPFETADTPYQVWTYFTPPITVVFADQYGIGMYELVTSWPEIRRAYERI